MTYLQPIQSQIYQSNASVNTSTDTNKLNNNQTYSNPNESDEDQHESHDFPDEIFGKQQPIKPFEEDDQEHEQQNEEQEDEDIKRFLQEQMPHLYKKKQEEVDQEEEENFYSYYNTSIAPEYFTMSKFEKQSYFDNLNTIYMARMNAEIRYSSLAKANSISKSKPESKQIQEGAIEPSNKNQKFQISNTQPTTEASQINTEQNINVSEISLQNSVIKNDSQAANVQQNQQNKNGSLPQQTPNSDIKKTKRAIKFNQIIFQIPFNKQQEPIKIKQAQQEEGYIVFDDDAYESNSVEENQFQNELKNDLLNQTRNYFDEVESYEFQEAFKNKFLASIDRNRTDPYRAFEEEQEGLYSSSSSYSSQEEGKVVKHSNSTIHSSDQEEHTNRFKRRANRKLMDLGDFNDSEDSDEQLRSDMIYEDSESEQSLQQDYYKKVMLGRKISRNLFSCQNLNIQPTNHSNSTTQIQKIQQQSEKNH